jgi:signal transduction histidine kinase
MRLTLLARIWLSTSVLLTVLFGFTGYVLQQQMLTTTNRTLQDEARTSFQAYDSLWRSRSETLASVAAVLSSMPNVRLAFQTMHQPTIRDAAGEIWVKVSDTVRESAFFVVADPRGNTVTALDTTAEVRVPRFWPMIERVRPRFPQQISGFALIDGQLLQLVLTPVLVDSTQGPALMSVLVTGYVVDHLVARRLKEATGGSEFLFVSPDHVHASTLNPRATGVLRALPTGNVVHDGVAEYVPLYRELVDVEGRAIGNLAVFRSFDAARGRSSLLQRNLVLSWLASLALGLWASFVIARRIIRPVRMLDAAAVEVARQNYAHRVPVESQDELGRLAATFNSMCQSIQTAQGELIRQERISTIGRMASSIVHDLRNPLAAIYGGAEMMVDTELTAPQMKRLAENIYRSSRRIQEMLQDLLQITRGKKGDKESCSVAQIVEAAVQEVEAEAAARKIRIEVDVPEWIEVEVERQRMERVFLNLLGNALEALPAGGHIWVRSREDGESIEIEVADDGPGISSQAREKLFQPFASFGKKNGLGLGLALSRQSVLEQGGDLWAEEKPAQGASFRVKLPRAQAVVSTGG